MISQKPKHKTILIAAIKNLFTVNRVMTAALIFFVILRITDPWSLQLLRLNAFDTFQQISPRETSSDQIVLVEIDENSLKEIGQWPWPRNLIASLVNEILLQKPKALGIDIIFSEPDRTSPDLIIKSNRSISPKVKELLSLLPSNDMLLSDSFRDQPVVLGMAAGYGTHTKPPQSVLSRTLMFGGDIRSSLPNYSSILRNIKPLETATTQGVSNLAPDPDGIIRQVPLLFNINGSVVPSLEIETLRLANTASSLEITSQSTEIQKISIGKLVIPTNTQGKPWLYFSERQYHPVISARDIISGKVSETVFADKIVLLGVTAVGIADYTPSPIGLNLSGLAIHAQAIDNILTNSLLSPPSAALALEVGFLIIIFLIIALITNRYGALELSVAFAILCTASIVLSWGMFTSQKLLIDPTLPLLMTLTLYLISASAGFVGEQKIRHEEASEAAVREREKEVRIRKLQNELLHTIGKSSVQNLSSSIAHELNQPMTAICNYTSAAKRLLDKGEVDETNLLSILGKILTQADRGNEILRSIRDVAETGKNSVKALDVNRIIQEEIDLIKDVGDADGIEIIIDFAPDLPLATANEIQLHQVLLNLIRNAIQAINQSKTVPDKKAVIQIHTAQNSEGMIEVSISDSGPGLTDLKKETLFKPFFTTKEQGMGLGLAISRSILEALGGALWVEDNTNKRGAKFVFSLPLDTKLHDSKT